MQDQWEKFNVGNDLDEGYPVAPSPPVEKHVPPEVEKMYARVSDSLETEEERPFQYSIADLLALTTTVAVSLSIIFTLKKFFSIQSVAGVSGLGALLSLIYVLFWPPERPLLRIGWWALFGLYLLTCIVAFVCK